MVNVELAHRRIIDVCKNLKQKPWKRSTFTWPYSVFLWTV